MNKSISFEYRDKEWLRLKYVGMGLSTTEIGRICHCHASVIGKWMRRHCLPMRTLSEAKLGHLVSPEVRLKNSERLRGKKGKKHSREAIEKIRAGKLGEKNPQWRGGITDAITLMRNSKPFAEWRWMVYGRDGFGCLRCGDRRGSNLNAHHIIRVSEDKDPALDVDNGITLCVDCHKFVHRFVRNTESNMNFKDLQRQWINNPVSNRTQTSYSRFLRGVRGPLRSMFTDAQDEYKTAQESRLKTTWLEDTDIGAK
jgi:5-methylcytosine-specific restriction endonuclease McrA